ncbi:CotH kinase family protein [Jeotgalibacillus sp. S-D1]|uniref:CotH kinase family protein n=1 Tax=Jeotgalibacillus sp. S-D1 TaxID=2552189 RepID=UPI001F0D11B5|nr:CotH kinase family protein [Jeotgalibacillus sp. S-D1]
MKKSLMASAVMIFLLFVRALTANAEETPIFNKEEISEVNIVIDESDFEDMLENPLEEEYKQATVNYNGIEISNTGVRVKGNSTLMSVANSESDRYSFKLNFNKYIEQDLDGFTKINLNNNFADPSYMREYLTYELMEKMGIKTPEYSYIRVSVNGEPYGLYLSVENIEEPYLERHFDNTTGNLFKADTGANLAWEEGMSMDDTNLEQKLGLRQNTSLLQLIEALDEGENVENYFDVDSYLRYLACSTVLANMDSYQGNLSHNYYLYEHDEIFTFLPWDHNMSIGGMGNGEEQIEMLIDEPTIGTVDEHPLTNYVLSNEEYKETYHTYLQEAINELGNFEQRVSELQDLIGDDVREDPTAFYSYDQFLDNTGSKAVDDIPGISDFLAQRIENVQQQLDGDIPRYKNGEGLSFGGMMGGGMMGGGIPGGLEEGQMPGGMPEEMPGEMPEGVPGGMPEGIPGDMPEGMQRGMPGGIHEGMMGGNSTADTTAQFRNLIVVSVLVFLLLGTTVFINLFKRYGS